MNITSPIDWLLFDLGGVVIKTRLEVTFEMIAAKLGKRPDEISAILGINTGIYRDALSGSYCKGLISSTEFFTTICEKLNNAITPTEFQAAFNAEIEGYYDITLALMQAAKPHYRLACLSNTNDSHWQYMHQTFPDIFDLFEIKIASQISQSRKPDAGIYNDFLAKSGAAARHVLFMDDRADNIEAATALGFQTLHITNPDSDMPRLSKKLNLNIAQQN